MPRLTFVLAFLLLMAAPVLAYAPDERVAWLDKKMSAALKDRLLEPSIWRRVPSGLDGFLPKPELPLVLKAACTVGVDSTFFRDLKRRGAVFTSPHHCAETIIWVDEPKTGKSFTFKELQQKFLPIDNEAEAASFLYAAGRYDNAPWYVAQIEGHYHIMADEMYCNGFAHHRRMFLVNTDGTATLEGLVHEPPPHGFQCPAEALNADQLKPPPHKPPGSK